MIYYFAYGSNLHPLRLKERVPSAELIDCTSRPGYRLAFHKKGKDGSGKCNMFESGSNADRIFGAIYRIEPEQKDRLDQFEGKGLGYTDHRIVLTHMGVEYPCFTYLAQPSHILGNLKPFHWYKQLVLMGAEYLGFPESYTASIEAVASVDDADPKRRTDNALLIERIDHYRFAGKNNHSAR